MASTEEVEAAKSRGNAAFKAGRHQEALEHYQEAVSLDPDSHILHSNLALALAALRCWKESESAARHSVELEQGFSKGWYRLAKAQAEQGKHGEVIDTVRCDNGAAAKELRRLGAAAERHLAESARAAPPATGERTGLDSTTAMGGSDAGAGAPSANGSAAEHTAGAAAAAGPAGTGSAAAAGAAYASSAAAADVAATATSASAAGPAAASAASFLGNPTIKDFRSLEELGIGNFSTILKVEHRRTGRAFALKVIEKAEAGRVKRRHPNIYNEIYMEKRALTRLHGHPGIAALLATFQDYNSLYYLLELCEGGELWSRLLDGKKAVGTHPSLARFWTAELVAALEWMHSRGLVHRDVKPENLMLTAAGHVKVVDFGTCKDLWETDLNGPEFVGTAQYMTPQ
ncbi:unnamed protein product, partial [Phaeothamnion confervicola]